VTKPRRTPPDNAREQIRAYLAAAPPKARAALRKLRATIRATAPQAVEGFSYRMPGFRLDGRPLVWYAAFTNHCSLFPITEKIRRTHAAALRGYETSKGTVRLPLARAVPVALVRRLVKARVAEVRPRT